MCHRCSSKTFIDYRAQSVELEPVQAAVGAAVSSESAKVVGIWIESSAVCVRGVVVPGVDVLEKDRRVLIKSVE